MNAQNTRETKIKQDQQHTLCYSFMIQLGISVSDKTRHLPLCVRCKGMVMYAKNLSKFYLTRIPKNDKTHICFVSNYQPET